MITPERQKRFENVIAARQRMTVILENVHDPHNLGAVLRTADSVGIQEVFVVNTDKRLINNDGFFVGKRSSSSTRKWMDVRLFHSLEKCMVVVKEKYDRLYATHLGAQASSVYENDMTCSLAFMFGNEKDGLTRAALKYADENIYIPQFGIVKSLNISVAFAVCAYEALRQRNEKGMYKQAFDINNATHTKLYNSYLEKNERNEH